MEKDSKYSFRVNKETKDKFKMYCKVMGFSPSEIFEEVMVNFNSDVDKIIKMQSTDELKAMLQGKFAQAEYEISQLRVKKSQ